MGNPPQQSLRVDEATRREEPSASAQSPADGARGLGGGAPGH